MIECDRLQLCNSDYKIKVPCEVKLPMTKLMILTLQSNVRESFLKNIHFPSPVQK